MNKYEGMFLLDHGKVKNNVEKGIDEVKSVLEKHQATVHEIGKWDERKLAYEINRQKRGSYVLVHFEASGDAVDEIRRECALNEVILRNLLIRLESKFPPFMTATEIDAKFGTRAEYRDRPARRPAEGEGRPAPAREPVAAPAASADQAPAEAEAPAAETEDKSE